MAGPFARGVTSPRSAVLAGELDPGIPGPLAGEDWKNMGEDEGTASSPLNRLDARGVACPLALGVGLLVAGCEFREERLLRDAGDDMMVGGW